MITYDSRIVRRVDSTEAEQKSFVIVAIKLVLIRSSVV